MVNSDLVPSNMFLRIGLGLIAMATVLLELILTRIFSVTAGYHFAFMIVSMTMFGMTLGALAVLVKQKLDLQATMQFLATNACFFAISTVLTFGIYSLFNQALLQVSPLLWIVVSFILFSIPFYFSGICVSTCLSRFRDIGKLYSADLIGAALACPLLVAGLSVTDGQNILTFSGLMAASASLFFSLDTKKYGWLKTYFCGVLIFIFCLSAFYLPRAPIEISGCNGLIDYVKWSPVGRVVVASYKGPAISWAKVPITNPVEVAQKGIWIDFGAFTVMTSGSATPDQLEPIKRDITAVGNFLRPAKSLFVIGVGGGRDILTGLLFGQQRIDGIEVNPAIVHMLRRKYADFVGNLTEKPGVNIINDEARNWLARSGRKYELIQCSLVDTWSASSSGAFMLTENVLYTKEAFELYLKHLEPHGILSFLRWGDEHESGQIMRMLSLAKYALLKANITDCSQHILLITAPYRQGKHSIGNMLVSLEPFSKEDINKVKKLTELNGYQLLLAPFVAAKEPFASLLKNKNSVYSGMPSDDCPFFFTPVSPNKGESSLAEPAQGKGLILLMFTLTLAIVLVFLTILIPIWTKFKPSTGSFQNIIFSAIFFGCLGAAFMHVEVGQLERLTVLLGNPTYGLSIVLFSMLLASGIGSYVVVLLLKKYHDPIALLKSGLILSTVLIVLSAFSSAWAVLTLESSQTAARIAAAIILVSVPAFFMGWGFPLGMIVFTHKNKDGGPWFWAINGASSVLGSILAAVVSVTLGITATLLIGAALYLIAWVVTRLHSHSIVAGGLEVMS